MKIWIWLMLPVLFLGGLTIGRWNPAPPPANGDPRRGRSAVASMDAPRPSASLASVTGMLRIPDRVGSRDPAARAPEPEPDEPEAETSPEEPRRRGRQPAWAEEDFEGETLQERIEWAADAWRLRTDIARDTFLVDAGLSREDAAHFDVLMHAMNLRLTDAVSGWVDDVQLRETVTPEDGVRLMRDLTEALVLTYDEMDRTLPPTWRDAGGDRFDLLTFVDPSVAMPLVGIEDRINGRGRGRN